MRIISGEHRGRRLRAPEGRDTRPILDHQKEALFNILREAFPCEGVLDLFAGSGALGIEALSRGVVSGTFVERGRPALAALRDNLKTLRLEDRARVLPLDVFAVTAGRIDHPVGAVFCDPPFPLWLDAPEKVVGLLGRLAAELELEEDAVFVLRVPTRSPAPEWPTGLVEFDARSYGDSVIHLARPAA